MKRRTKAVLLVAGLAVVTAVASVVVLAEAFAKVIDPHHHCGSGFSTLVDCTYHWSSSTTHQGTPDPAFVARAKEIGAIPSGPREPFQPTYDQTSWAVVQCPENYIARRLLCAAAFATTPAQAAEDDLVSGLPRPKPWLVTTAKDSTVIKAFHVETPLDLAEVLRFYRLALSKRGWSENAGAVVESDGTVIAFTTSEGPALLRLTRQDDRTIADLSLRKPVATKNGIMPIPGQARLLLGNPTDEAAVVTVNGQTIELAAHAALADLADYAGARSKTPDGQEINLTPGKYRVSLKVAGGAAQSRELELAADETWGLVAGPAGVPLPLRVY